MKLNKTKTDKPTAHLVHLVLPDIPIAIGADPSQNQKAYPVFLGGHFFAPESYCDTNQNTNFETN